MLRTHDHTSFRILLCANDSGRVLCNVALPAGEEIVYVTESDRILAMALNDYDDASKKKVQNVTSRFSFSTVKALKEFIDVLATIEMTHPGSTLVPLVAASAVGALTPRSSSSYSYSETNMGRQIRQQVEKIARRVLQKWFRYLLRSNMLGSRNQAATNIQRTYRSYHVRLSMKKIDLNHKKWRSMKHRLVERNRVALVIQQNHIRLRFIRRTKRIKNKKIFVQNIQNSRGLFVHSAIQCIEELLLRERAEQENETKQELNHVLVKNKLVDEMHQVEQVQGDGGETACLMLEAKREAKGKETGTFPRDRAVVKSTWREDIEGTT